MAGRGLIYIHTEKSLDTEEREEIGWEDFLHMTVGQAVVWAAQNIDPKNEPSELACLSPT
jgi:adenylylsulfate reductase subunit A